MVIGGAEVVGGAVAGPWGIPLMALGLDDLRTGKRNIGKAGSDHEDSLVVQTVVLMGQQILPNLALKQLPVV